MSDKIEVVLTVGDEVRVIPLVVTASRYAELEEKDQHMLILNAVQEFIELRAQTNPHRQQE